MARFVIDVSTAIRIIERRTVISPDREILAPTLLRSQVLDHLYQQVQRGDLTEESALSMNSHFSKLKFRYLGDAVLRRRAWTVAASLGLSSTLDAEYIALTQLQADALVASDEAFAEIARTAVEVRPFEAIEA